MTRLRHSTRRFTRATARRARSRRPHGVVPSALPPLQTGPVVWYGPALRERDWLHEWTAEQIRELEHAADRVVTSALPLAGLTQDDFPLPTVGRVLREVRQELLHGLGFRLLRGLPIANYSERELTTIYCGIGAHIGSARSQNSQGHLVGHVCDLRKSSADPNTRIYQTNERQTFHTDSSDVVGLLCVRPAKRGGESLLVSASTVYNEMRDRRPDLLEYLLEPIATDRRGEVPPGQLPYLLIPVLSWHERHLTPFYQRQYIDSAQRFHDAPRLTARHVEALDLFDQLLDDPQHHLTMSLEPGDFQFVYNHALLHDRTAFEDEERPGERRHLLRLWLSVPGDRELPEVFATRFGSVEVGNRGGIVVDGMETNVPGLASVGAML